MMKSAAGLALVIIILQARLIGSLHPRNAFQGRCVACIYPCTHTLKVYI